MASTNSKNTPTRIKPFLLATAIVAALTPLFCRSEFSQHALHAAPPTSPQFLVAPYLQLGDHPKLLRQEQLEIIWFTTKKPDPTEAWKAEVLICDRRNSSSPAADQQWQAVPVESHEMGMYHGAPYFRLTAAVKGLPPGEQFQYRIWQGSSVVFSASGTARKSYDQPYRFAVFGDVGAGSPGQKKVAFQCLRQKPDFTVMPGDIVYDAGRVSEYLARFFPIMNSDTNSATAGAPLLRSTLNMTAIGNHDIAYTGEPGVNFTRFPDALGYYVFWSQPLNGPFRLRNSKNTALLIGDSALHHSFLNAVGQRFPTMGNYSFDYGNSHWLVLDGNPYTDWRDEKARAWVEKDLGRAQSKAWRFVTFHQPGFSADRAHHIEHRMRLLCDLFEKYKVDIVFSGHAHDYQRTFPLRFKVKLENGTLPSPSGTIEGTYHFDKSFNGKTNTRPDGVIYIVSGGGGAMLYPRAQAGHDDEFIDKFIDSSHSFTICDVNKNQFKLTQLSDSGTVLDQFEISKD